MKNVIFDMLCVFNVIDLLYFVVKRKRRTKKKLKGTVKRAKTQVNLGQSFSRRRELWDLKGLKTDPDMTVIQLAYNVTFYVGLVTEL